MATKTDTDKVVEQLGGMTVLELVELKNKLEEEWGVTAAAPMAVAAPAAAGGGDGAAAEEKTEFDVVLTGAGGQKIQVIKVVRADHGPGPEGGQGPGRRCAESGQGGCASGGGGLDQGAARRGRRSGRSQVAPNQLEHEGPPRGGPSSS